MPESKTVTLPADVVYDVATLLDALAHEDVPRPNVLQKLMGELPTFAEYIRKAYLVSRNLQTHLRAIEDVEREARVDAELQRKLVVLRDGARGWRLGRQLVWDAIELLELNAEDYPVPEEGSADYEFAIEDYRAELEPLLAENGYTVVWNDGYAIYGDLSAEALVSLEQVGW